MAHAWEDYVPPGVSPAQQFMSEPWRRCAHCGKVQQRETQHSWMRVTGRIWRPLAGRCKGAAPVGMAGALDVTPGDA